MAFDAEIFGCARSAWKLDLTIRLGMCRCCKQPMSGEQLTLLYKQVMVAIFRTC